MNRDLAAEFDGQADQFEAFVRTDLDAAHAWLDGKWLVEHYVGSTMQRTDRTPWVAHVASIGGLPEVADLWSRVRP